MTDALGGPSDPRQRRNLPNTVRLLQPAILVGLATGLVYGIVSRVVVTLNQFQGLFGVMTLSFLFLVPLVIGYLTVRPHPNPSWVYRLLAPWLPTVLSVVVCAAVGWEGNICIVMGLPLLLIFSSLGGVLGAMVPARGPAGAATAMLLPFLLAPVEQQIPRPDTLHEVHTSISIAATPAAVWAEIVQVPPIRPEEQKPALFTR